MEDSTLNTVENQESKTGEIRDEQGRFVPGVSGNPEGRPPMTEEERLAKKAREKFIDEYVQKLTEALPQITPVLIQKASDGDMNAIKEVNDRVMGKPKQAIVGGDEDDNAITINIIRNGYSELENK